MKGRYGLSIRAADSGDADGLLKLLAAANVPVARERLSSRLSAANEKPGAVLVAEE